MFIILFIVMHFIGNGLHGGPGGHSDDEKGNEKHPGERPESESGRKEHREEYKVVEFTGNDILSGITIRKMAGEETINLPVGGIYSDRFSAEFLPGFELGRTE